MLQRKHPVILLALSLSFFLSAGCELGESYSLKVNAVQNPEVEGLQSYKIVSSNAEVSEDDLWFKETAEYVKTALSGKGLYEAPSVDRADMIVDIAYGVGDPIVELETYEEPIIVERGGRHRTVTEQVSNGRGGSYPVQRQVYVPREREVVGSEERQRPVTKYEKYLRVTARENQSEGVDEVPAQVWSIYVTSKDESKDLREYLPVMAAAATRYVGETTEEEEEIKLKGKDEVVAFVKEGM